MNKAKELDKIAQEIAACKVCKRDSIGVAVPGEGNPNAQVVFIGEAPGKNEAISGRPFIGRSGKLLREAIRGIGLNDEKDVYITSPVKYLPKAGTPTPAQIAHGRKYVLRQLAVIKPKIIVLMGRVAALGVLDEKIEVAKRHGEVIERDGQHYFLSYHPAAAIRFVKFKQVFLDDFKKLKKLVK
jgi:DNA polymerase